MNVGMLKPLMPVHYPGTRYNGPLFGCRKCKRELDGKPIFCPRCGTPVKWDNGREVKT